MVLVVRNPPANARDVYSTPGSGKAPGGRHGNPLQYSRLENPMYRGAWRVRVHRVKKSWTRLKQHSTRACTHGNSLKTCSLFPFLQLSLHNNRYCWYSAQFPQIFFYQLYATFAQLLSSGHAYFWAFLVAQTVKNLPAMWETQVRFQVWEDPLEMGMATHSNILAWRIPWTEEPGRLQSIGSQRVGHDWETCTSLQLLTFRGLSLGMKCCCAPDLHEADPKPRLCVLLL